MVVHPISSTQHATMAKRKAPASEETAPLIKKLRRTRANEAAAPSDEAHTRRPRKSPRKPASRTQASSSDGTDTTTAKPDLTNAAKPTSRSRSNVPRPTGNRAAARHDTSRKKPEAATVDAQNVSSEIADEGARLAKPKRKTKAQKELEAMPLADRTQGLRHFIGAHVSIAKGVHNSVHNALHIGGNAFALFLKSQRKWETPPLQEEHATLFHGLCNNHKYSQTDHIVPHGSYLVNLASVNPEQRQKSITSFLDDMKRCQRLGIRLYNFHPGNTNGAPRDEAYASIAEAINLAHAHVPEVTPLLETMASNKPGSNVVGGSFEDLAGIIAAVKDKSRVGVCIDTCHVYAAGYDLVSEQGFQQTMKEFDKIVGRKYLRAWHLNDSKAPLGSGRDLHANIGTGFIGLKGFWNVMNMDIWGEGVGVCGVPMVLETPTNEGPADTPDDTKGKHGTRDVEDKNVWATEIKLLESLVGMDPLAEEYVTIERELSERGRENREKMTAAIEKKQEMDKRKGQRAKSGKGREKKQVDRDAEQRVQDDDELGSELSAFEIESEK